MKRLNGCFLFFLFSLFCQSLLAQSNDTISPGQILLSINASALLAGLGSGDKPIPLLAGGFAGGPGDGPWGGGGSPGAPFIVVLADKPSAQVQNPLAGKTSRKGRGQEEKPGASPSQGKREGEKEGATGGQQPFQEEGQESSFAEAQSLLALLDQLMEQFTGEVVLLTDLDDTLLPSNGEKCMQQQPVRLQFKAFIEKWRQQGKIRVIVVTRAKILAENWGHFAGFQLPDPDFLISQGSAWLAPLHVQARPGQGFSCELAPGRPLVQGIRRNPDGFTIGSYMQLMFQSMSQLSGLFTGQGYPVEDARYMEACGVHAGYIVWFTPGLDLASPEVQEGIKRRVFDIYGIMAETVFCPLNHIVRIRLPLDKEGYVSRLAAAMSLQGVAVITAGDTIDDFGMLLPGEQSSYQVHTAIVVGNARENLKEAVKVHNQKEKVVFAKKPYLLGVIEGMLRALRKLVDAQAQAQAQP